MADGRQPEDSASQWALPGNQDSSGPMGENGFSFRTCQPGAAHASPAASYAKENGFNGDLPSAHEVTADDDAFSFESGSSQGFFLMPPAQIILATVTTGFLITQHPHPRPPHLTYIST
ncbi:microtubule-associated protein 2 isoform X10 [Silurus meridionalis]|nr:microtubule-associated protein 2 isoform X10 [Silurus meridionalis]